MTVDFNNQKILNMNTAPAGQTAPAMGNTYANSVMVQDYCYDYEEEVIQEEALPGNPLEEMVTPEDIKRELKRLAQNLNITYNELKSLTDDILKNNDAFQGRDINSLTRKELTEFITSLQNTYQFNKSNNKGTKAVHLRERTEISAKAYRKGVYDNELINETCDKYGTSNFYEQITKSYPGLSEKEALEQFAKDFKGSQEELYILISSMKNDEERFAFLDFIQYIEEEFVTNASVALYRDTCSEEYRELIGEKVTSLDFLQGFGNNLNYTEHVQNMYEQFQTGNIITNITTNRYNEYNDFQNTYKDELTTIKKNIAEGKELTPEQEELLRLNNILNASNAGAVIGINNNTYIDSTLQNSLTGNILNVFNEHGNLSDITTCIAENVIKNPDILKNISPEDFTSRLDKLTNGEYSKTAENVKNSIEAQKLISSGITDTNKAKKSESSGGQVGFTNKEKPSSTKLESYTTDIENNSIKEDNTPRIVRHNEVNPETIITRTSGLPDYIKSHGNIKGFVEYAKAHGTINALKEAFRNWKDADTTQIKKIYQRQNTSKQASLIKSSGVSSIKDMLNWSKDTAVQKLEGKILATNYATDALEDKLEEIDEKKVNA